jgi:hypothetical protein
MRDLLPIDTFRTKSALRFTEDHQMSGCSIGAEVFHLHIHEDLHFASRIASKFGQCLSKTTDFGCKRWSHVGAIYRRMPSLNVFNPPDDANVGRASSNVDRFRQLVFSLQQCLIYKHFLCASIEWVQSGWQYSYHLATANNHPLLVWLNVGDGGYLREQKPYGS